MNVNKMDSKEYKPGFKAWLFSIIFAAGFGSLLADGIRSLIVESRMSEAVLVLKDKHSKEEKSRFVYTYYFENIGDKITYVTSVVVDGEDHPIFFTNSPIEVFKEDANKPIKRAHVAVAKPNKMLMISIVIVDENKEPSEICFMNGDQNLICI